MASPTLQTSRMQLSNVLWGIIGLTALAVAQDTSVKTVTAAFEDAKIPQDLGINFNPTALLGVTFPLADGSVVQVHAGVNLERAVTAQPPTFTVNSRRLAELDLVVVVVDPDAPTPQNRTASQIRQFLGGEFVIEPREGNKLVNSTPAISEWRQPTPPAGSDPHRYVFLLFTQGGFDGQTLVTPVTPASKFNISQFAQDVNLGDPVGGTFMFVGPEA